MTQMNLCELARQTIQPIVEATGHTITLDDFDDISALNQVACKVMSPNDPRAFRLLMRVVPVAGTDITLHPATISRVLWIHQYAGELFADDVHQYGAMVLALSVDDPRDLYTMDDAEVRERVEELTQDLDVHATELVSTMTQVLRVSNGEAGGDADPDFVYGPIVAALVREYGSTHDYWMHEANMEVVESTLDDMQRRNEAESEQAASAAGSVHFARAYLDSMSELRTHEVALQAKWEAA